MDWVRGVLVNLLQAIESKEKGSVIEIYQTGAIIDT